MLFAILGNHRKTKMRKSQKTRDKNCRNPRLMNKQSPCFRNSNFNIFALILKLELNTLNFKINIFNFSVLLLQRLLSFFQRQIVLADILYEFFIFFTTFFIFLLLVFCQFSVFRQHIPFLIQFLFRHYDVFLPFFLLPFCQLHLTLLVAYTFFSMANLRFTGIYITLQLFHFSKCLQSHIFSRIDAFFSRPITSSVFPQFCTQRINSSFDIFFLLFFGLLELCPQSTQFYLKMVDFLLIFLHFSLKLHYFLSKLLITEFIVTQLFLQLANGFLYLLYFGLQLFHLFFKGVNQMLQIFNLHLGQLNGSLQNLNSPNNFFLLDSQKVQLFLELFQLFLQSCFFCLFYPQGLFQLINLILNLFKLFLSLLSLACQLIE